MTDKECLITGLAVSLFVHCMLLGIRPPKQSDLPVLHVTVEMDMDTLGATTDTQRGLGVESATPKAVQEANAADHKRQVFLAYLDAVDAAVHARRLDSGDTDLIGVATCAFLIRANGTFSQPTLYDSSGHAALDAAALQAVRTASGTVRRPTLTGTDPIPMRIQVKYQYGLR